MSVSVSMHDSNEKCGMFRPHKRIIPFELQLTRKAKTTDHEKNQPLFFMRRQNGDGTTDDIIGDSLEP